jgi:hypothetical protein
VRICASKKKITNCSQCEQLIACKNFETLEKAHPEIKEDLKKIRDIANQELVKKWTSELSEKWPHCILLCKSAKSNRRAQFEW